MIHKNKEDAQAAIKEYNEALVALQEKLGIWEECEDSCVDTHTYAEFHTEDGETRVISTF